MAKLNIDGKEYEMIFNTQALTEIIKKFGGLENMQKKLLESQDEAEMLEAYIWLITLLINQAILSENIDIKYGLKQGQEKKTLTEDFIKIKMRPKDIFSQRDAVFKTIVQDSEFEMDIEDESEDEELKEIREEKNA